ncbi:hypothetical protein COV06_03270 [Candidatus Uhrbacteria bacterium CG10_big_fil_rev_8_21_14_0_10_50_16]|uniref:SIS domain-containing protein n=1 Tax=Candidatus Uhrbacteria bacterium CG10_big_fil_rev_8_21_14_0_10_50_16 TaxID=1975039 RepID=A0A2H0RLT1_9BACT|nr:MAG: hypothetical protein COV06_03270 [Candidatus Uhrbacteria bacterium CG10_big_fil_rev_8_21_14_0_10_50_16]
MPLPLNTKSTYEQLDGSNALMSISMFPEQCAQAWSETKSMVFPKHYLSCTEVVVAGMGGSGLGGHLVNAIFGHEMNIPLIVLNDYDLPKWVNRQTLVIVVSYSGSTEEALSMCKQSVSRHCATVVIASGGRLEKAAKRAKVPAYIFSDFLTNPANMPRMGIGLTLFAELGILKQLSYLRLSDNAVKQAVSHTLGLSEAWSAAVPQSKNIAKKLAVSLQGLVPVFVASEHLVGNALTARNQTHESSKCYSDWHEIPEMNHHLLEGLQHPEEAKKLAFVLFASNLYHTRNQKRHEITAKVLKKSEIAVHVIDVLGETKLEQALAALQLSSYVSFYLGTLNGVDPSPIPWVDYFKEQLA